MSHSSRSTNLFRVALVGASSLKGKEVREVLGERGFPSAELKLLDDDEMAGTLEQVNDEPAFIQGVTPEVMERVDFAFLAAGEEYTARSWATVRDSGSEIIDLSYALENNTDVALRSPWVERELGRTREVALQPAPVVVAHPAAVMLALLLARLQQAVPMELATAVVGHPASEYGRAGMDELHDQTVNLLSFQQMPSAVFGTQAAFNMFAHSVEAAHPPLAEIEARILRHLRTITEERIPLPALMVLQTPVFHGYTVALFVQSSAKSSAEALEGALAGQHITIHHSDDELPSNVNVAGVSEILASVRQDAGGRGFWIFAACDNLRLSAIQAVECAEEMIQTRPRGQLQ
jgi:aspartate-semialdehyde dehydrogenase